MSRVKATTLSMLGLSAVNIIPDLKKKMYIVVKHRSKIGKAEGMRNKERDIDRNKRTVRFFVNLMSSLNNNGHFTLFYVQLNSHFNVF